MKKFVKNVFACSALCLLAWFLCLSTKVLINKERFGGEVFEALAESTKAHANIQNVILGDSVANQIFSRRYQSETSNCVYLASNQAVTPIGNCALLKMYLEHNPQTKNVCYVVHPCSLGNDGGVAYTFHYMLYPFIESGAMDYVDRHAVEHFRERFSSIVFDSPFVRRMIYADNYVYGVYERWLKHNIPSSRASEIPPECIRALDQMQGLCAKKGIRFKLLSVPVSDKLSKAGEDMMRHLEQIGYGGYARDYSKSQLRIPDDWLSDHIHFKADVLKSKRSEIKGRYETFLCNGSL